METITKSFNIFVDSGLADLSPADTGIDYQLNFNNLGIDCPSDGFFRLSIVDFNMVKTFTNINSHDSLFILQLENTTNVFTDYELQIPHKNYAILYDLALDFFTEIGNQIKAYINAQTANAVDTVELSNINPSQASGVGGTSNNVLSSILTFKKTGTAVDLTPYINSAIIQTHIKTPVSNQYSSAYQILGSKLIQDITDRTTASMTTTLDLVNGKITITGFYPGTRFNEPCIYLCCSLPSDSLATSALNYFTRQSGDKADLNNSNILLDFLYQVK